MNSTGRVILLWVRCTSTDTICLRVTIKITNSHTNTHTHNKPIPTY